LEPTKPLKQMANDLTPWKMVFHTGNLQRPVKYYKLLITKARHFRTTPGGGPNHLARLALWLARGSAN